MRKYDIRKESKFTVRLTDKRMTHLNNCLELKKSKPISKYSNFFGTLPQVLNADDDFGQLREPRIR